MNIKILNAFLKLNFSEKLLSIISLLFGLKLTISSAYYIWAYNFSSILFLFMIPMTILVSELLIGLFMTLSGYYMIVNGEKSVFFYKMAGILMILYPLNHFILDKLDFIWLDNYFIPYLILPFGLFIYILMFRKTNTNIDKKQESFRLELVKIVLGLVIFILIDVIFCSWNYLDRIL